MTLAPARIRPVLERCDALACALTAAAARRVRRAANRRLQRLAHTEIRR